MKPRRTRVSTLSDVRGGTRPVPPLPPGAPAPLQMQAELHYLYSLLTFSDAYTELESMQYTPGTKCGRLTYERDGARWVVVIREDVPDG